MTYRVMITDAALASVEQFLDYLAIEQQSPEAAQRWWRRALAAVESLRTFPHRCPIAPENAYRDYTIRMQLVGNHLFLFRVDDEQRVVRVFAFRHGAMLPRADELPDD